MVLLGKILHLLQGVVEVVNYCSAVDMVVSLPDSRA